MLRTADRLPTSPQQQSSQSFSSYSAMASFYRHSKVKPEAFYASFSASEKSILWAKGGACAEGNIHNTNLIFLQRKVFM